MDRLVVVRHSRHIVGEVVASLAVSSCSSRAWKPPPRRNIHLGCNRTVAVVADLGYIRRIVAEEERSRHTAVEEV